MNNETLALVVEDDPASLANTQLLLELEGFRVATASDGIAGLAAIHAQRPDIVICDIMMPGMDGMALLAEVRNAPAVADTPFVFLTALVDRHSQRSGMNGGADDYLTKPFEPKELLDTIAARLRRLRQSVQPAPSADGIDKELARKRAEIANALSQREMEILALIGEGLSSRRIAEHLGISLRTVDSHRAKIITKLDLDGAFGLVRLATKIGDARTAPPDRP